VDEATAIGNQRCRFPTVPRRWIVRIAILTSSRAIHAPRSGRLALPSPVDDILRAAIPITVSKHDRRVIKDRSKKSCPFPDYQARLYRNRRAA
jgi:hypothetical protein